MAYYRYKIRDLIAEICEFEFTRPWRKKIKHAFQAHRNKKYDLAVPLFFDHYRWNRERDCARQGFWALSCGRLTEELWKESSEGRSISRSIGPLRRRGVDSGAIHFEPWQQTPPSGSRLEPARDLARSRSNVWNRTRIHPVCDDPFHVLHALRPDAHRYVVEGCQEQCTRRRLSDGVSRQTLGKTIAVLARGVKFMSPGLPIPAYIR